MVAGGLNTSDTDLWIGVYKTMLSFTYIGCIRVYEVNSSGESNVDYQYITTEYEVPSIGDCRVLTGCQTIGIKKIENKMKCICIDNLSLTNNDNCTSLCTTDELTYACGLETGDYYSFYTTEKGTECDGCSRVGHCLTFKYDNNANKTLLNWNTCTQNSFLNIQCSHKAFYDSTATANASGKYAASWIESVQACFQDGKYPASYQSLRNGKYDGDDNQLHWTGVLRILSPITLNETGFECVPIMAGYIIKDSNEIKFKKLTDTAQMLSLCTPGTHAVKEIETCLPSTWPTTTVIESVTTDTTPSNQYTPTVGNADSAKGVPAGTIAGVSVSLVVLMVVVIIILIILRKRGLLLTGRQTEKNRTADVVKPSTVISDPFLETTTNTQQNETPTDHCYFVLECAHESKAYHLQCQETEGSTEENEYNYIEDTGDCNQSYNDTLQDYDTAKITHTQNANHDERGESFNVYNRMEQRGPDESNNEYDHINGGKSLSSQKSSETEYNYNATKNDGEAYSHLKSKMTLEKGMAENTYNVTESSINGDEFDTAGKGNVDGFNEITGNNYDKVVLEHLNLSSR
ncbi:uncharacterized protein LOC128234731 isoform X2 [Mya arenaria]|nr:uncharacterized protein LOC128234731 isoform X2 [Mya arenaria]